MNAPKRQKSSILLRRQRALRGSSALTVLLRAAPVALAALSFTGEAHAQTVYNGATNGSWMDSTQWSTGVAPTTTDDPTIVQSGSVLIGNGQNAQGGRLDVSLVRYRTDRSKRHHLISRTMSPNG